MSSCRAIMISAAWHLWLKLANPSVTTGYFSASSFCCKDRLMTQISFTPRRKTLQTHLRNFTTTNNQHPLSTDIHKHLRSGGTAFIENNPVDLALTDAEPLLLLHKSSATKNPALWKNRPLSPQHLPS